MAGSRPVVLLRALGEFSGGLRFDKLAALLRHPDAEGWVARESGGPTRPWLSLLDRYATDHLAARPVGGWLGNEKEVEAMEHVYRAAVSLLPVSRCGVAELERALGRLERLSAPLKRRVILACTGCIAADREVTVREAELMRGIADAMGVPMPPLLPGQRLA